MYKPSKEKSRVLGTEFDWFATDADGHVGHFSTAGYGPVPLAILTRLNDIENLDKRVLQLPVVGRARGHVSGQIEDWLEMARRAIFSCDWQHWLEMARRGIFSYDWQHWSGPYRRAATPSQSVHIADLPEELSVLIRLVVWPEVRFAKWRKVRPEQLCPCE